ncbi:MAG: trypsin-like serine protease [Bdellovibrionaceae bacterium]|nr:trypsin-like serine protease [Pseudobdellovibrionaceae bacterium]MBX3033012.1 trypsin-like serine protease [Pseudobdellovibrionaceae bacterium]
MSFIHRITATLSVLTALLSSQSASAIMNGIEVSPQDAAARHIVGIVIVQANGGAGICTGTLLGNNLVMTAAHCAPEGARLFVVFDRVIADHMNPALTRPVDKVAISPSWQMNQNNRRNTGDIALIRYVGPTPARFQPLPVLPFDRQRVLRPGNLVILAGYGRSSVADNQKDGSGVLRQVSTRLAPKGFSMTELLVEHTDGRGACNGDSGGPAVVFLGGQPYVWGVTSRGIPTCDQGAVYTNATLYQSWIQTTSQEMTRP